MRIIEEVKLDYSDVLISPKRSILTSRKEVDLTREFSFRHSSVVYKGIPIMAANMDTIGTFYMAESLHDLNLFTCIHKHYEVEDWLKNINKIELFNSIALSSGISSSDFEKSKLIISKLPNIKYICLDVANGYTESFVNAVKDFRKLIGNERVLIAGNVVTADMTEALILAGADIVKVGIGPGSVCTTRKKAGVGYPQLSAVIECADAAHGLGGHIIADGGCIVPGDVAKAFGAGADFVMLGGMLAGHAECLENSNPITLENKKYMEFYGMSSTTAQEKYNGSLSKYRSSEGKKVLVPFKGYVKNTIQDILGGVRSACTYTGSKKLKELSRRTNFIRVSRQTNESLTIFETDS